MNRLALLAVVFLTIVSQRAVADCGGIPFKPKVTVFESDQRTVTLEQMQARRRDR